MQATITIVKGPGLGGVYRLEEGSVLSLGRAQENDVVVEDLDVSRHHCTFAFVRGRVILTDLKSTNGTFVDGKQVSKTILDGPAKITLGATQLHFVYGDEVIEEKECHLRLQTLGNFEITLGQERLEANAFRTQKTRYLLPYVLCFGEVSEDRIVEDFWGAEEARGRQSLNTALWSLRKVLGNALLRQRGSVQWNPELSRWHDLEELNKAYEHGDFSRVVQLYRGSYLDSCYMDWANEQRRQAEQRMLEALTSLMNESGNANRHQQCVEYAQRLLGLDPCRQDAHLRIMQSHLAVDNPELAVRQYENCVRVLKEELDMEPSLALFEAYQRARMSL